MCRVVQRMPVVLDESVIRGSDQAQCDGDLWILMFPEVRGEEWHERDAQQ